jgi:ankyrin repeat protein
MKQLLPSLKKAFLCLTISAPTSVHSMLRAAVVEPNIEEAQRLLELKTDPDAHTELDEFGNTPLNRAVLLNNPKLVELLVSHGASPHAENNIGNTPLSNAQNCKLTAILKILLPPPEPDDEKDESDADELLDDIPDFPAVSQPPAQTQPPLPPALLASIRMGRTPSPE